ncbi:MAG: methionyl-tRNA formyltransferase [Myxococcota bacterium]
MRSVFFGTPAIACPSLKALDALTEVVAVVTQPDRPSGRGLKVQAPEVKVLAEKLDLTVYQPKKVRDRAFREWLTGLEADIAVVIAYGRILPGPVLAAPRLGCLNLHASILPRYRGAAPINWAIARGETQTGVSLMQMDEGMDTGPVFSVHTLAIGAEETAGELYVRLGALAAEVVERDLPRILDGDLHASPQDDTEATMAPMLNKEAGRIAWARPAHEVSAHMRGMMPWPGAFTERAGKRLRITQLAVPSVVASDEAAPGTITDIDQEAATVACAEGSVRLAVVQLAGKKALTPHQLVQGRQLAVGDRLGEAEGS